MRALLAAGVVLFALPARAEPDKHSWDPSQVRAADVMAYRVENGHAVAPVGEGLIATLTLDPRLQAAGMAVFEKYHVPRGALVVMSPATGRILAMVGYDDRKGAAPEVVFDPEPPAASVFKVVTGSALVDAGVKPTARVCFHDGTKRLELDNLTDNPARDRECATLREAMGKSLNPVFGRLAVKHLTPAGLETYAANFGFGELLPFDVPTRVSTREVPTDTLEFGRAAAGFWHMHMSPLQAALMAAALANGGQMPKPFVIDEVRTAAGATAYQAKPSVLKRVVSGATARVVGQMMELTVTEGTAKNAFRDAQGRPLIPGVRVAGKTGTLDRKDPYAAYTWWVGFAPAEAPRFAVAALVVNGEKWRIKASQVAAWALKEALR